MKKLDILLLILFPLIAVILSLGLKLNFIISTLIFFGLPSVYLSFRTKKVILRTLTFTLLFGLSASIVLNYMASLDNSWEVPTIFPFRLLDKVSIEEIVWSLLIVYFIVIFYEHFFDKGKHKVEYSMRYLAYILISILVVFLLSLFTNPDLLKINYFYLKAGLIAALLPLAAFLFEFHKFVSKFIKTGLYFFYLGLLNELTALQLGYWSFPGSNFIGWVTILGHRFPFEELLFFLMIFAIAVLAYFEFFDDREHLVKM